MNVTEVTVMIFNSILNSCLDNQHDCGKNSSAAFPYLCHLLIQMPTCNLLFNLRSLEQQGYAEPALFIWATSPLLLQRRLFPGKIEKNNLKEPG